MLPDTFGESFYILPLFFIDRHVGNDTEE